MAGTTSPQPTPALVYIPGRAFTAYTDPASGSFAFDSVPSGTYSVVAEQKGSPGVTATLALVPVTAGANTILGPINLSNTQTDAANCGACGVTCAPSDACVAGSCQATSCAAGYADCNGAAADGCETDVTNNVNNCGACGRACSMNHTSTVCGGGQCLGTCQAGYADCNLNRATDGCEVDLMNNASHCGACGLACAASQVCSQGVCH